MFNNINEKKIKKVAQKIATKFYPDKIILFGSWAWGKPGPDSDVDLLIVKETKDARKFAMEVDGYIFPRPFPLDIIVYRQSQIDKRYKMGDFFISEIMDKGKILYAA
ncbi:MAG: nucleotidyltransferase domain-containing protein [Deltaproteobacteria bacterium]|nr:nucleotidyltransferase domain-containing protein [Deltaproteobacteria bacterium]